MPRKDTQFKKGQSGNPAGRPKHKAFGETLRELMKAQNIDLEWTMNGKPKRLSVQSSQDMHYAVSAAVIMEAMKGNVAAVKEIANRCDGMPTQQVSMDIEGNIVNVVMPPNKRKNKG